LDRFCTNKTVLLLLLLFLSLSFTFFLHKAKIKRGSSKKVNKKGANQHNIHKDE
jgi:hypothetical protein